MRIILAVLVGLFIFSCNPTTEKKASDAKAEFKAETPVEKSNTESTEFQFLDFKKTPLKKMTHENFKQKKYYECYGKIILFKKKN